MKKQTCKDPAARPEETAKALAKAAVQTAQRSLFTAQLASDALAKAAADQRSGSAKQQRFRADAAYMTALRDALLDALNTVPEEARKRISASGSRLTSDELIDLLALSVQG
ncbi:MAG: hypothetical protein ACOX7Q_08310 [Kiritimatiellia bacterium]|jgi:L-lactate utilization protein LutC